MDQKSKEAAPAVSHIAKEREVALLTQSHPHPYWALREYKRDESPFPAGQFNLPNDSHNAIGPPLAASSFFASTHADLNNSASSLDPALRRSRQGNRCEINMLSVEARFFPFCFQQLSMDSN